MSYFNGFLLKLSTSYVHRNSLCVRNILLNQFLLHIHGKAVHLAMDQSPYIPSDALSYERKVFDDNIVVDHCLFLCCDHRGKLSNLWLYMHTIDIMDT